ncbi:hypothetical protein ACWGI8_44480, partial [Streptomyces sp. NPDC054841]
IEVGSGRPLNPAWQPQTGDGHNAGRSLMHQETRRYAAAVLGTQDRKLVETALATVLTDLAAAGRPAGPDLFVAVLGVDAYGMPALPNDFETLGDWLNAAGYQDGAVELVVLGVPARHHSTVQAYAAAESAKLGRSVRLSFSRLPGYNPYTLLLGHTWTPEIHVLDLETRWTLADSLQPPLPVQQARRPHAGAALALSGQNTVDRVLDAVLADLITKGRSAEPGRFVAVLGLDPSGTPVLPDHYQDFDTWLTSVGYEDGHLELVLLGGGEWNAGPTEAFLARHLVGGGTVQVSTFDPSLLSHPDEQEHGSGLLELPKFEDIVDSQPQLADQNAETIVPAESSSGSVSLLSLPGSGHGSVVEGLGFVEAVVWGLSEEERGEL